MTSEIGSKANMANPALKPFAKLVGAWRTSGTHPLVPGTALHGRASFAWLDGGAFLVWRTEVDDPRFPDGITIIGSDDQANTVFTSYFDERGISRRHEITIDDDGFTMERLDPKFSQRMTFRVAADGNRIVAQGQMSREGGAWEDDLSTIYERQT